ncbi:hypothetical protein LTR86_008059 [Recurvomyces mirabilis]|nr:hypothetical protein LTR86_008059 [Recurvomyces mirabilis]
MSLVLFSFLLTSCLAYETVSINVTQSQTNAPLNTTLAYYRPAGFNGNDDYLTHRESAADVIMVYGGGNWVDQILEYGSGGSVQGIELFKTDQAWQIYHTFFDQLTVTNSSVFDYQAGGTIEYDWMVDDHKNDRKVDIPTQVFFFEANLGAQFDMLAVWTRYVHPNAGLTIQGIGEQKEHFIIEETPDELCRNGRSLTP